MPQTKENYRPISLMNIDAKINKKSSKQKPTAKMIIYHDQVGFYSRDARILQYSQINVVHHIYKLKDENHMIISIDALKAFDKFNTHL